jgi:PAS domain S-box-containing protein
MKPRPTAAFHAAPLILFLLLAGIFSRSASRVVLEPPLLLPILGTMFLVVVPFVLAFFAAGSFLDQGTRIILLLGCGMVSTGVANLFASWGLSVFGDNFAVTAHNLGSLLAGSCHLLGIALIYFGRPTARTPRRRRSALAVFTSYGGVAALLVFLAYLAATGSLPAFFPSTGPSLLRQAVLTTAALMYALGAGLLFSLHARTRVRFFLYYADALFLMAIGLGALLLGQRVGGILGWIGRLSQYAGSIYFIVAVISGWRETGSDPASMPRYLTELFRFQLDGEVRTRTRDLQELNKRLEEEIGERTAAEELLRLSEERLRLAAEAAGFGVYSYQFDTGTGYYSAELLALFGLPPEADLPMDSDLVVKALHPDDRDLVLSGMSAANDPLGPGILDMEYRIFRTDGETRWLRIRGRTSFHLVDGASRPALASGIVQDITERKLVEQKLLESEGTYRSVIENSLQGVAIMQDARIVLCNNALCAMNGYSKEETYRMTPGQVLETIFPDDRFRVFEAMDALASNGTVPPSKVIRLIDKAGRTRWVEVLGVQSLYRGRPSIQLSYIDVTEKRRAEEAYRSLVDHAIDGLAIMQDGRIVFANAALTRISGYEVPEVLRMTAEEVAAIMHPDDRAMILQAIAHRLGGRAPRPTRSLRIRHRDGRILVVETQAVVVDYEGSPALQVTYRDVTAERAAEAKLNATHQKMRNLAVHLLHAREEERRKVAQEIHDEFGQSLAALKMDMHWLAKHLHGVSHDVAEKIRGMIILSEQTIGTVQSISAELRPRMLDDLGLAPALDWLAADFSRRTSISCAVAAELPPSLVGGNAATTLYRVVQEALSNVARHSHARSCAVQLSVVAGEIHLRIEDDGIGITPEQASAAESYGIIGIHERVEGLGGTLAISGTKDSGSVLLAQIPLPEEGGLA